MVPPDAFTVTVSVWLVPMALFAVGGVIVMLASTHVFEASPLFAPVPSVARLNVTPLTFADTTAWILVVPVVAEVMTRLQLPLVAVPSLVKVQVFPPTNVPGPDAFDPVTV